MEKRESNFILIIQILITLVVMGALICLFRFGYSRKIWFEESFYNESYTISATYPSDGMHKNIVVTIKNKKGDILWSVDEHLDFNIRMTEDYYDLEYEKDYLKLYFKNENKGIDSFYRIYYEDLKKCE